MTIEFFREVLDRFPRAINIGLTGGEPLVHTDFFDMIHLAHERHMKVHIPTNGTLLHRNLDAMLEAPVTLLNVSLYGADAEAFSQLTGANPSLFKGILDALTELMSRRKPGRFPRTVQVSFVCAKNTMHQATEVARLCEKLRVDQLRLTSHIFFGMAGYDESMCLYDDDPEVQDFFRRFCTQRFRIPVFLPVLYRRSYDSRICDVPFQQLSIDSDGYIGPCCIRGTGKQWDNFFTEPDVWNGPTMIKARQDLRDLSHPLAPTCMNCREMARDRPPLGV